MLYARITAYLNGGLHSYFSIYEIRKLSRKGTSDPDDDDVFYLFLKQNRSRAPCKPIGRYVP